MFRAGRLDAATDNPLPFVPVAARGARRIASSPPTGPRRRSRWCSTPNCSDGATLRCASSPQRCAERIVALLERPALPASADPTPRLRARCGRPTSPCWCARAARRPRCDRRCAGAGWPRSTCRTRSRCSPAPRRAICCACCRPWPRRRTRAWRAPRSPRARSACRWTNWRSWPTDDEALRRAQRAAAAAARRLAGAGRAGDAAPGPAPAGLPARWLSAPPAPARRGRAARRGRGRAPADQCAAPGRTAAGGQRPARRRAGADPLAGRSRSAAAPAQRRRAGPAPGERRRPRQGRHRAQGQGPGVPAGLPAVRLQLPRRGQGTHALRRRGRRTGPAHAAPAAAPTSSSLRPTRSACARTCACSTWR